MKSPQAAVKTLCDVCVDQPVSIKELTGNSCLCQRLRELGLSETARVVKILDGRSLICRLENSRIALNTSVARQIVIEED